MVYNNDGRSINKEKPCVEDFLGGQKCGSHTHIRSTQCKELKDFIQLEAQTTRPLKYGQEKCHAFVDHVTLLNGMSVNYQSELIHGTDMSLVNEITHLEENQTKISIYYDHISDLVQAGTNLFI